MFKLVTRGIRANLGRLTLTLICIFVGVAFMSGSFILADSLRSIFGGISAAAFQGVDAQVRAEEPEIQSNQENLIRFDGSVVGQISDLPEVEYAEGGLFALEQAYSLLDDGEVNRPQGPPVFTGSWGGPSLVSAFRVLDGDPPTGQQVALDKAQVKAGGYEVGDTITMSLPTGEPEQFELSGIIQFGDDVTGGAYFILYDLPTAQRVLGAEGLVDSIAVNSAAGVSSNEILAAIETSLPAGLEVVTGETVIGEQDDDFGEFIDIFGNILLGFAIVVLFVSTFIIYNTFAILVGQRTQQLGLLRSIGASAGQIRLMMLIESVIIGLIASIAGLFGGLGVAALLKKLFSTGGGEFPDGPLQILPRTVIVVVLVGMIVTVVSALLPAFRASRVAPLEAIRTGGQKERSTRFRVVAGTVVLAPGLIALGLGMFAGVGGTATRLTLIGVGAALTFIGVSMVSALFAGPAAGALGQPVEAVKGVTGRIARDNASRNPQRTTATATALMIGLALITGVAVLTESVLATFDDILEDSLTADLFIFEQDQGVEFASVLVDQIQALPETEYVAGFAGVEARIAGEVRTTTAFDSETGARVVDMGVVEGTAEIGPDGLLVFQDEADDLGLTVGDTVPIELEDGFSTEVTVKGIFDDDAVVGARWLLDRDLTSPHVNIDGVGFVGVIYPEGADPEASRAAVEAVTVSFPQLTVQDNTEFRESLEGQINQLQIVISALLVLCLIVAFIGIVNTMVLSVLERTREIGLLRAVGMTRGQVRSAIRWEAVIVSLFGSLLGVLMGLLLGWAAVVAVPDSFISKVGIPWFQVGVYVIVGAFIGVIAAYFPARRAAKLDVLQAIATG
ncbi:MAG: FtsX-like permease family protein [Actinomycetia bacterium]|nr:FtsX-like permease family protein [Actinomycetes bacterium]